MESLKSKIQKINFKIWFMSLASIVLLFGSANKPQLSTDTYSTLAAPRWTYMHMIKDNGRIISGLVYKAVYDLNIGFIKIYYLSYFAGIIFAALAVMMLANVILKLSKCSEYTATIISCTIIANLYSFEYYLFIETGLFMLSLFSVTLAVSKTVAWFDTGDKKQLFSVLLCLVVSVEIYQTHLAIYIIALAPIIMYYSKSVRSFVVNNIVVLCRYTAAMIVGIVPTKYIFKSGRVQTAGSILNLSVLSSVRDNYIHTLNVIPHYRYILLIAFVLILSFVFIFAAKENRVIKTFSVIYVSVVTIGISFAPYILSVSYDYSARILYPVMSIIGVLAFNMVLNLRVKDNNIHGYTVKLVFCTLFMCLIVKSMFFTRIFNDRYSINRIDNLLANAIQSKITEYETETGITVTNVAFYNDMYRTRSYPNIRTSNINLKMFDTTWSDMDGINYYTGKSYWESEPKDEYKKYFANKNWDGYDEGQLIFDGDTLHLCLF